MVGTDVEKNGPIANKSKHLLEQVSQDKQHLEIGLTAILIGWLVWYIACSDANRKHQQTKHRKNGDKEE